MILDNLKNIWSDIYMIIILRYWKWLAIKYINNYIEYVAIKNLIEKTQGFNMCIISRILTEVALY